MSNYQTVCANASQLPLQEQLRLIDDLASLVPDDHPPSLSKQWLEEINRRSDEIATDKTQTEEWLVIRERLFRKYGLTDAG